MPEVSIIIPYYNAGDVIVETLKSISDQSYSDYEVILVDDGSFNKFKPYKEDNIICIRLKANKGVAVARNIGLQNARGNLVQFLDSGDTISKNKISKQAAYINQHGSVDFVFSDFSVFHKRFNYKEDVLFNERKIDWSSSLLRGRMLHLNAMLFRRDCLVSSKGFDEDLKQFEDWHLWLKLLSAGYLCAYVPGCSAYYIKDIVSSSLTNNVISWSQEMEKMLAKIKTNQQFIKKAGYGRYMLFSRIYFLAAWRLQFRGFFVPAFKYYLKSFFCNPFIFMYKVFILLIKSIQFASLQILNKFKSKLSYE